MNKWLVSRPNNYTLMFIPTESNDILLVFRADMGQ